MRFAAVQARVASMEALLQIVGAMRSLAGMRLHEAVTALEGVHRYGDAVTRALQRALDLNSDDNVPSDSSPAMRSGSVRVLCASEHGFVGALNERLLQTLESGLVPDDALLVLGSRGASLVIERGHQVAWQYPMATRLGSIPEVVQQTLLQIYHLIAQRQIQRVEVLFARLQKGGGSAVERRQLLPLDPPPRSALSTQSRPLCYLPPAVLLEKLTGEYIFAQLTEALTESVAGENGARFAAMAAAHDNASRKLDQLQQEASQARQEEITSELLDLMVGELAISSPITAHGGAR